MKRIIFLLAISLFSCSKDKDLSFIPAEVINEVNSFKAEAKSRGINIEFKGLRIILQNTNPILGHPGAYFPDENCIRIDTTSDYYKFSANSKENLIFHELGHAILKRQHRDEHLHNGNNASIMNCCSMSGYSNTYPNPSLFKRQYYVDELFNESTPAPFWAN